MHSRFLFDADFSGARLQTEEGGNIPLQPRSDLEKAEYDRGFEAGRTAAHESFDSATTQLLEQIAASLLAIRHDSQNRLNDIEQQLVAISADLTAYFAAELDPIAILTKPQFGIANIIEKIGRDSQLTLLLAPKDAAEIRERCLVSQIEIAAIHESDAVSSGHFELRWPEGGVIFDRHRLDAAYTELLEHYQKG